MPLARLPAFHHFTVAMTLDSAEAIALPVLFARVSGYTVVSSTVVVPPILIPARRYSFRHLLRRTTANAFVLVP